MTWCVHYDYDICGFWLFLYSYHAYILMIIFVIRHHWQLFECGSKHLPHMHEMMQEFSFRTLSTIDVEII